MPVSRLLLSVDTLSQLLCPRWSLSTSACRSLSTSACRSLMSITLLRTVAQEVSFLSTAPAVVSLFTRLLKLVLVGCLPAGLVEHCCTASRMHCSVSNAPLSSFFLLCAARLQLNLSHHLGALLVCQVNGLSSNACSRACCNVPGLFWRNRSLESSSVKASIN